MTTFGDIDISGELDGLRRRFDAWIDTLPTHMARRSAQLSQRLRIKRAAADPHWIAQFAPFTSLYPLLQARAVPAAPRASVDKAMLAHLCLVVHAFIADRDEDRQEFLDDADRAFASLVRRKGLEVLGNLRCAAPGRTLRDLYPRRIHSVAATGDTREGALESIAPQKAAYGILATHALLRYSGIEPHRLEWALRAFNRLTIALQYADDLEDWRDDLRLGDDNLLLARLADHGLDPYALPNNDYRIPNVGHALLRHGIFDHAHRRALFHLDEAIGMQRSLNCEALVQSLLTLRDEIAASLPRVKDKVTSEVLVACLLVQLTSA